MILLYYIVYYMICYIELLQVFLDFLYNMIYNRQKKKEGDNMKTPEYTKKAVNKYRDKFDLVQVRFEKDYKTVIQDAIGDMSINDYIVGLVKKDIEKRQRKKEKNEQ